MNICVPDELAEEILDLIETHEENVRGASLLNCDEGCQAWVRERFPDPGLRMVARRNCYRNIHMSQILENVPDVENYPVIMRGAKYQLYFKYSKSGRSTEPTGWNNRVLKRFLRRKKATYMADDRGWLSLFDRISKKFEHKVDNPIPRAQSHKVMLINGEVKYFTKGRSVMKSLARNVRRFTSLERAVEQAGGYPGW